MTIAVQRQLVELVERHIHQPRERALDQQAAADQTPHQIADGRIFAERDQRAEIAVAERLERPAGEAVLDLAQHVAGLLMRRLGARRHGRVAAEPWAGGAIAERENVVVARGLQSRAHHQLVDPVGLEPADLLQGLGRLDAGGPHDQLGVDDAAVGELHAGRQHRTDLGADMHHDAELLEQPGGGARHALGQGRQDARRGVDQMDAHVAVGLDAVEPVGDQLARALMQLGGELDPGGAGADDRDRELVGAERLGLGVRADAGIDQPAVEALGLVGRIQAQRVFGHARRAEIIGQAADRDYQRVVAEAARLGHHPVVLAARWRDLDLAARPVDPGSAPTR